MAGFEGEIEPALTRREKMTLLVRAKRKSAVLTPSALPCLSKVPTINLTAGCLHGRLYCYARSYRQYPGEGRIILYANTLDLLQDELARRRTKPKAVYFSPSSDLFQPAPEVLELAEAIIRFLLDQGIGVSFVSKGHIPNHLLDLVCENASLVRSQIGIISLAASFAALFEPGAASPGRRLWQLERLVEAGIPAEARIDPIIPTVTDDFETLGSLFAALARVGVRRAAIDALFLRPAIVFSLQRSVRDRQTLRRLLAEFPEGRRASEGYQTYTCKLPRERRLELFERTAQTAMEHGVEVVVCACENPDIARGSCNITGDHPLVTEHWHQLPLSSGM